MQWLPLYAWAKAARNAAFRGVIRLAAFWRDLLGVATKPGVKASPEVEVCRALRDGKCRGRGTCAGRSEEYPRDRFESPINANCGRKHRKLGGVPAPARDGEESRRSLSPAAKLLWLLPQYFAIGTYNEAGLEDLTRKRPRGLEVSFGKTFGSVGRSVVTRAIAKRKRG